MNNQQTLEFEKVGENDRQRFYKLSIPVNKAPNTRFDWEAEKEHNMSRLKEEYKKFHTDMIEYVCVSDAKTHIERLLFVAIPLNDDSSEFGCMSGLHLDGKHTFMIDGGDNRHVHPDEVYLRRLASANDYQFKMKVS